MMIPSSSTESNLAKHPVVFDDFFDLDEQESASPFLTPHSRVWAVNLPLKASIFAACLLALSFIFSFFPSLLSLSHFFLISVYFLAGIPALIESLEDLAVLDINIDILMTLAAFSSVLIGSGMEGGLLLVLFALSGSMEEAVTTKAKGAMSSLYKLSPTLACVMTPQGTLIERSVKEIKVGTHILVKAGQVVPLDGKVVEGTSSVNLVHLTGENFPVIKKVGDLVPAGARNLDGFLTLEVFRTSNDSTLAKIIQLVTQAQEARPRLQRWFDTVSRRYAITIILLSLLFATSLPWLLNLPFLGTEGSLYRALAFLIAASPCALIIAIPIAYLSAISACARRGILLKGGLSLDALASCSAIAFDKTGTLTTGDLTVEAIEPIGQTAHSLEEALKIAYTLEMNAVHPIAKAILKHGQQANITPLLLSAFKSIPGYGLEAHVASSQGEVKIYLGRPEYMMAHLSAEKAEALRAKIEEFQQKGELLTVLLIEQDLFLFRFRDTPRNLIKETLQKIKKEWNLILVMLTGDHRASAKRIAEDLGILEYHADLTPEGKLRHVSHLAQSRGLAMIGDGINDAPALARATVGICMGKVGSTSAIDASDIVLLQDNIDQLHWLIKKAHQTQRIVRQNLTLAGLAIVLASLPALLGVIPLWLAVILHEGGTVLVGLNGLRLMRD
ncbi:heavy metal translocating P-type ATPase [Parachlamydia sp. AcF125]|uniref:heavy metal translocating P-type ATPase n=1 Tax=Parachlamydia sp. AcF125 TaxID=2795736 RepID=UPI001BD836F1|nr:heavy metal translocating P-type ATPase [Parachlamydia sp. AcF125]MBS4168200.1 putative cadmium-transporting ATPase [Parachlamydia sp. AcF125]